MNYRQIFMDGLWRQNTGLVVLLGLCPLLAVSGRMDGFLSLFRQRGKLLYFLLTSIILSVNWLIYSFLLAPGCGDTAVAKTLIEAPLVAISLAQDMVRVYPNPASTHVYIDSPQAVVLLRTPACPGT